MYQNLQYFGDKYFHGKIRYNLFLIPIYIYLFALKNCYYTSKQLFLRFIKYNVRAQVTTHTCINKMQRTTPFL